jgi:hypothetical protein
MRRSGADITNKARDRTPKEPRLSAPVPVPHPRPAGSRRGRAAGGLAGLPSGTGPGSTSRLRRDYQDSPGPGSSARDRIPVHPGEARAAQRRDGQPPALHRPPAGPGGAVRLQLIWTRSLDAYLALGIAVRGTRFHAVRAGLGEQDVVLVEGNVTPPSSWRDWAPGPRHVGHTGRPVRLTRSAVADRGLNERNLTISWPAPTRRPTTAVPGQRAAVRTSMRAAGGRAGASPARRLAGALRRLHRRPRRPGRLRQQARLHLRGPPSTSRSAPTRP